MSTPTCADCKFWKFSNRHSDAKGRADNPNPDSRMGECHFNPPAVSVALGGHWRQYPATRATDDCSHLIAVEPSHFHDAFVAGQAAALDSVLKNAAEIAILQEAERKTKSNKPKKVS